MTTSVTGPLAVTATTSLTLQAPGVGNVYASNVLLVNNSPFLAQVNISGAIDWLQPSDRAVYAVEGSGASITVAFQQAPNGPATAPAGQPSFLTATWYDPTDPVPDTPPTPLGIQAVQITGGTVNIGTITGTVTISGSVTVSGTVAVSSVSGSVTVTGTVNVGTISGTVTISGAVTVTSGTVNIGNTVTVSGSVSISSGTVSITGTVSISGAVTVTSGSITVTGTVNVGSISGTVTISGAVTISSGTITISSGTVNVGTVTSITNNVAVYAPAQTVVANGTSIASLNGNTYPASPLSAGGRTMMLSWSGISGASSIRVTGASSATVYANLTDLATPPVPVFFVVDTTVDAQFTFNTTGPGTITICDVLGEPVAGAADAVSFNPSTNGCQVTIGGISYATYKAYPIAVSTAGAVKVDGSAVTQPVSLTSTTITGTVACTQSGTWNIGTVTSITNTVNVADQPPTGLKSVLAVHLAMAAGNTQSIVAGSGSKVITVYGIFGSMGASGATAGFYAGVIRSDSTSVPVATAMVRLGQATAVGDVADSGSFNGWIPGGFALPAGEGLQMLAHASNAGNMDEAVVVYYSQI